MFKRYRPFFKAGMMDMLAYKFNLYTWLLVSSLQVACLVFLWLGVYQSSLEGINSIINGFNYKEMLVYIVFINIFNFVTLDENTLWTIDTEVHDGTIAMSFVKPISYRLRMLFTTFGAFATRVLVIGIPLFIISYGIFYGIGFIVIKSALDFILHLILFIISQMCSLILYDTFSYIFGILCFYTTSSFGLNQLMNVVLKFFSGSLIPISFFPGIMKDICYYLPFAGISQNPILILINKASYIESLKYIGLSLIWIILLNLIAKLLFYTASKKVTVQGG